MIDDTVDFALKTIPAIIGIIAAWFGFKLGLAKNTWRIEAVEKRVDVIEASISHVDRKNAESQISLGVIQVTLEQIKVTLAEMREDMKRKQDK